MIDRKTPKIARNNKMFLCFVTCRGQQKIAMRHHHVRCRRFKEFEFLCYLQKVSTLFLRTATFVDFRRFKQLKTLREKKTKGKSLHETGVSNWRLR